ncbi:unnamed protein product [Dovyalis caffra]|uniref:Ribosomal protein L34e superfamily protein n=1 Tax=Dovyalis caffra TaxID=77055 RepID=A0AAV1RBZ4_9ROSI|nr:unnamed protein product [Dovyalis caffra]
MPPSSSFTPKPFKSSSSSSSSNTANTNSNPNSTSLLCRHSPSATLDLLILILVLFSGTFLLTSYFSYIFNSLSLLLSNTSLSLHFPLSLTSVASSLFLFSPSFLLSSAADPDLESVINLATEDCVKSSAGNDVDKLPWKGGTESNPDYECLRAELRKMGPPNGRAILLFRAKCGCPVAKLEGWGPKRGRRHKKGEVNNRHFHLMCFVLFSFSIMWLLVDESYAKPFSSAYGFDTAMCSTIAVLDEFGVGLPISIWAQLTCDLSKCCGRSFKLKPVEQNWALANVAANGGDHR